MRKKMSMERVRKILKRMRGGKGDSSVNKTPPSYICI